MPRWWRPWTAVAVVALAAPPSLVLAVGGASARPTPSARQASSALGMAFAQEASSVLGPTAARVVAPALGRFAVPRLAWRSCGDPLLCTSVAVPLDWSHPQGRTISLSLVKLPATDRRHRIGTLFVNPGGPGGSGVDMVAQDPESFSAGLRRQFDIVGFDPRFVGGSRPAASCLLDDSFAVFAAGQPAFPLTDDQERAVAAAQRSYTHSCASQGDLAFASTGSVARDLDLLRQAVGDDRLSYLGYSYGTYLGQVYAQLFPGRIRAMVLDGVLDGQAWRRGTGTQWRTDPFSARIDSAAGSSHTLARFLALCAAAGRSRCALAAQGSPAVAFAALAEHVRSAPIDLGAGDVLDYPALVTATTSVLYSPLDWQSFAEELQALYVAMMRTQTLDPARVDYLYSESLAFDLV